MSDHDPYDKPRMEITPAEAQTLKRCLDSSLWTHSAPAALASLAVLKFLSTRGFKTGVFVNSAVLITAALSGRAAALPKCVQQVMSEVPEGTIAKTYEEIRNSKYKKKEMVFHTDDTNDQLPVDDQDLNLNKPQSQLSPSTSASSKQTYDDLRRKNREEFINRRKLPNYAGTQNNPASGTLPQPHEDQTPSGASYSSDSLPSIPPYYDPPSPYIDSVSLPSSETSEDEPTISRRKRVNKYGDEIED